MKGKIKTLLRGRRYGFIKAEDENEIFFHETGLIDIKFDSLEEGQQVQFDVEKGEKGLKAVNVKLSAD
jgi:CspA family cold shock protein